jgi:peptide/nickel transport system substrate-binding protein
MKDPDLKKPLVREAFQHIFDWKSIAGSIMRYNGYPWQSVIPKGMVGAPDDATATSRFDYDPAKAKALLAQAGYPDGLKKKLYPSGASQLPAAEALQSSAKAAGVDFELVPGEWTPSFRTRDYQVMFANSGAKLPDPFSVASLMAYNPDNDDSARLASYDMWRTAQFEPDLNKLVEASGKEADPEKREELFKQIDQYYAKMDPGLIIFFQRTDPYAVRANVKGYQGQSTWNTRWDQVTKQ